MKLIALFDEKTRTVSPWDGQYKIPWDEPEFSRRMLREHLSQDHDLASRKMATIDEHVGWIHEQILGGKPSRVFDLACGPGFYSKRLTALGHTCRGIDFSPASIEYANENREPGSACEFALGDARSAEYGEGYDAVLFVYGEFNAFSPEGMATILGNCRASLRSGGQILIEAHTFDTIKAVGEAPDSWFKAPSGLFSDEPHIVLQSNAWDGGDGVAISEFVVIDAATAEAAMMRNTLKAYTPDDYRVLMTSAGFDEVELLPSWGKAELASDDPLFLIRAHRP